MPYDKGTEAKKPMSATLAAYVPFPPYIPPTKLNTTAYQQTQIPTPKPQTQGLTEGGIIILICAVGLLFCAIIDRR